MSTLWTFGDSFTAEYFPVDDPTQPSNYDKYKSFRGGNLPDTWPTLLSKKLGMRLQNMGVGGDSNYGIFYQFIRVCEKFESGDIVIVGWANLTRFIAANIDEGHFNQILACENDFIGTHLSRRTIDEMLINRSDKLWSKEVHGWIKFINLYLEIKGVKVYHWTSDIKVFNITTDIIDDKRFIVSRHPSFKDHTIMAYLALPFHYEECKLIATIERETNETVIDYHFGEYGHKCQSEYFYNHIMELITDNTHTEFILK